MAKKIKEENYEEYDGGEKASFFTRNKTRILAIGGAAIIFLTALILGITLGIRSCSVSGGRYFNPYPAKTSVGYHSEQTGYAERVKPVKEMKNGGLPAYPEYGKQLESVLGMTGDKTAMRDALIAEANSLAATGTWNAGNGGDYVWMDKDGFLYNGTVSSPEPSLDGSGGRRQLYKHTASVGLYGGDVSDGERGVIKKVTLSPRGYDSYSLTGVYAPAGEVIKIQLSEADMKATGGITVHIGQALYNGKANNIWTDKNTMNRMPVILNTMQVNENTAVLENGVYTSYVGSFLGGPLYIRNNKEVFTVTVSGAVNYQHFILGYTTEKEFENNAKSSAPYFDMEVRNYGVLHSGPSTYAKKHTYGELYKAAVLWEKVSLVSTSNSLQGIVFLYDPFVAAGAAVAFPSQQSVNCPTEWMANSLDYKTMVTTGAWGNFHEYHHNFQSYGVGEGGEVTNNGMSLVSYALFTKISASRGTGSFGAEGLDGWNRYTSATFALNETLKIAKDGAEPENGKKGLALYATLLHNFGPDDYIQAKVRQQTQGYGESYTGYMRAWQEVTHNDMTYYFKDVLKGISEEDANRYKNPDYPVFVPVSCVYQTGRSYSYDNQKRYIQTMQPYLIPAGEEFELDLNRYDAPDGRYASGSVILSEDFTYSVVGVSSPERGQIKDKGNGVYTYTPDGMNSSGKISVTLSLKHKTNLCTAGDVELILEFKPTQEHNKNIIERTTYLYTAETAYKDATEAFDAQYAGFIEKTKSDNVNRTQNCNTDVWYTNAEGDTVPENAVVETEGKLYIGETAKYRIALRGRWNVALYTAVNDGEYSLCASYKQTGSSPSFPLTEGTYKDMELNKGDWVRFKAVMITGRNGTTSSFIGVGFGKFTPEHGVFDDEGNLTGTVPESVEVSYANAYRSSYEFPDNEFETDYFYTRDYIYNYKDNLVQSSDTTLVETNYDAEISWNINEHPVTNLFDGDKNTWIHTGDKFTVSKETPLKITADLGGNKPVNRLTIHTQYRPNGDWHCVKSFRLYGRADGGEEFLIGEFNDAVRNGTSVTVDFDETVIRYYRLEIFESTGRYLIISDIEAFRMFELNGGKQLSPSDEKMEFKGSWTAKQAFSTFGQILYGKKNDTLKFDFEGTRIAVLCPKNYKADFEVYIDGKKADSVTVKDDGGKIFVSYLSPDIGGGKHDVEIKCKGKTAIDSVVIFN